MTIDNKVSHTPGPWDVLQDGDGNALKVTCERKYGGLVALASNWWYSTEIAEANARLIAAAPEILLSLKTLAASLEVWQQEYDPDRTDDVTDRALTEARTLLARIDGENNA